MKHSISISKTTAVFLSVVTMGLVGTADYFAGNEYSLAIFYLISIILAAWFVNAWFAVSIAILSVLISVIGTLVAGAHYSTDFVAVWLILVRLTFYLMIIWLMGQLKWMQDVLESKVAERTSALKQEVAGRMLLEQELLDISEREQQRIGHDLHDSLCQHLTGTALAGQVLVRKMSDRTLPESDDLQHIVKLIEDGITLARHTARGLFPVEFNSAGLMSALEDLATHQSQHDHTQCLLECKAPVFIKSPEVAGHLFRIAQEAVRNAAKHSHATRIVIAFDETEEGVLLEIRDNGKGLPLDEPAQSGMGLQIMKYRASMIDADFELKSSPEGTIVTCRL